MRTERTEQLSRQLTVTSLEFLKSHLRLTHSELDSYIEALGFAAEDLVGELSGLQFREAVLKTYFKQTPSLELPFRPVSSVTDVSYLATSGNFVSMIEDVGYKIVVMGEKTVVYLLEYPSDLVQLDSFPERFRVTYQAGFAVGDALDPQIELAVAFLAANWFHRILPVEQAGLSSVPYHLKLILSNIRFTSIVKRTQS